MFTALIASSKFSSSSGTPCSLTKIPAHEEEKKQKQEKNQHVIHRQKRMHPIHASTVITTIQTWTQQKGELVLVFVIIMIRQLTESPTLALKSCL